MLKENEMLLQQSSKLQLHPLRMITNLGGVEVAAALEAGGVVGGEEMMTGLDMRLLQRLARLRWEVLRLVSHLTCYFLLTFFFLCSF